MHRSSRAALARSKSIDQQLDEDRERREREIQLLILGGASSGKSTFIKQLQIHIGQGYSEEERGRFTGSVYENVLDAVHALLGHMEKSDTAPSTDKARTTYSDLKVRFPKKSNMHTPSRSSWSGDEKSSDCAMGPVIDYSSAQQYMPEIHALWTDPAVTQCFSEDKSCREVLEKSDEYFLEQLDRIAEPNYVPTIQDILYIRKPTLGVQEHLFSADGFAYRVIDVAGQKNQRKKWIHFFDGVTAVMFFVALSGFCEDLREDTSLNSLHDSLQTFQEVTHNRYLERTDFLLFLNKKDIFEEKLKDKRLSDCFEDYKGDNTVTACSQFVREKFLQKVPANKKVYPHVSCAVDVGLMRKIISDVMRVVVEINLRKASTF